jgi:hypothetical protein
MEIKMSEFEPLNIAHYQQPTTPLSDGAAPYMDWIEVKRLVTDKTYQREISRAGSINVERIAEYFEWAKFSPVIVAPVEGGMFSIIDGQHRATAAMLRGIEKVPCEIVHIDRARQAEAFAAINGNITRVSAQVVYYARLTGKDPEAEEMARVLSAAEVTVCRGAKTLRTMKRGETNAVGAIFQASQQVRPGNRYFGTPMHHPNGIWQSLISSGDDHRTVMRGPSSKSKMERFR